jgi:GNAT superfamily N-acetyltransferase
MKIAALPVDRASYEEAAALLGRAFRDDPIVIAILEGIPRDTRVTRLTIAFAAVLRACAPKGMPVHVREENGVTGVAIAHPPGAYPLPIPVQLGILLKTVTRTGVYGLGRWLTWLSRIDKQHPKSPHYYLEFIGVDPAWQGNGLGSSILHHLVSKADQDRVGCFLETGNPRNVPLYQRFGFQTVAEEEIIGVHAWFMWRPPA